METHYVSIETEGETDVGLMLMSMVTALTIPKFKYISLVLGANIDLCILTPRKDSSVHDTVFILRMPDKGCILHTEVRASTRHSSSSSLVGR